MLRASYVIQIVLFWSYGENTQCSTNVMPRNERSLFKLFNFLNSAALDDKGLECADLFQVGPLIPNV